MTEEASAKSTNKPSGVQLTGIILMLLGLVLTLVVAPIIGLPLLFIGLIVNLVAALKKPKAGQPETPGS